MTDLTALQVGNSIRLSFTLPRTTAAGERLAKPQEVEILRAVSTAGAASTPSDADLKPWQTLTQDEVERNKQRESFTVTLLPGEPPGAQIRVAVRTATRGFRNRPLRSELSNASTLTLLDVPGPIQDLQSITTEKAIELNWKPSSQTGATYRVFRSQSNTADSFVIISETSAGQLLDSEFIFDHSYFYKVIAVVRGNGSVATSEDSSVVEIVPRDTFPPQPPQGLTALFTTQAVELIWSASSESDLRGYFVYRREDGQDEVKITPESLATPIFRDANVSPGKNYTYRVTAIDSAGNESGPSGEVTAEVR